MDREQYLALVKRLEQFAADRPAAYRRRVILLSLLGYAFVISVLVALGALMAGIIAFLIMSNARGAGFVAKLLIVIVIAFFFILRAMWVQLQAPEGVKVTARQAPELFNMLSDLQRHLRTARLHVVLITDECNAAMAEIPRLGLLGWPRNYLILGLPLMEALSPEQFRAVVAHELGHLSHRHGRMSGWIYRQRIMWMKLLGEMETARTFGAGFFRRFFNWYAPHFSAYSFVLARMGEYEADRMSVEVAGAHAGEALIRTQVIARILNEDFWPSLERSARERPKPPENLHAEMRQWLQRAVPSDRVERWVREGLNQRTDITDTHPVLAERLAAMNCAELAQPSRARKVAAPIRRSAAQEYLGDTREPLARQFSDRWLAAVSATWGQQHVVASSMAERLTELRSRGEPETLNAQEQVELAHLTANLEGDVAALSRYEAAVVSDPQSASAHFALGRILAERGDLAALAHLDQAMDLDPDAIVPACSLAIDLLRRSGRHDEEQPYMQRGAAMVERLEQIERECCNLSKDDQLVSHGLEANDVQRIVEPLSRHPEARYAYLVRKPIAAAPNLACLMLVVHYQLPFWKPQTTQSVQKLQTKLASELNYPDLRFFVVDDQLKPLLKAVKRVPGSLAYDRRFWKRKVRTANA